MTLEQFLYTNCPAGLRADDASGSGGFGLRGRSPGVTADRWKALERMLATDPPPTARLAFFALPNGRLTLLHTAPSTVADDRGRGGFAFNHVLLDLPPDTDPLAVIRTWGSSGWLREYTDPTTDLPTAAALPPPGSLTDAVLIARLADPKARLAGERVLAHLLATADAKVYLYAPAEVVAEVFGLAARCLPPPVRAGLTFSTYERGFHNMPARVLGTYATDSEDMPASCYTAPNLGLNLESGRASAAAAGAEAHPYAAFAVAAMAADTPKVVDSFLGLCKKAEVTTAAQLFDLFDLLIAPARFTPAVAHRLLARPPSAAMVAASTDARDKIAGWAVDGNPDAGRLLGVLLATLTTGAADLRADLANRLEAAAFAAAEAKKATAVQTALTRLREVDTTRADAIGTAARKRFPVPATLRWAERAVLLDAVRRSFGDSPPREAREWLAVPSAEDAADLVARTVGWSDGWVTLAWAAVADANHLKATGPLSKKLAGDSARVFKVSGALTDPDTALAGVYESADSLLLAGAFEAEQLPPPRAVVARLFNDTAVTLVALHLRAVLDPLKDDDRLTTLLRGAVKLRNVNPLFAPNVIAALDRNRVDSLMVEVGWEFANTDEGLADYALFDARRPSKPEDTLADAVAGAERLAAPARNFLASRLIKHRQPDKLAELLDKLTAQPGGSAGVAEMVRTIPPGVGLLAAVIRRASGKKALWALADTLLDAELSGGRVNLTHLAREAGEPIARGGGCLPAVVRLATTLFDAPYNQWPKPGQPVWAFLDAATLSTRLTLPDELLAVIEFQQAASSPNASTENLMAKSHGRMSEPNRKKVAAVIIPSVADKLLASPHKGNEACAWLIGQLNSGTPTKPLINPQLLETLIAELLDQKRRVSFLKNHHAVAAVFYVGLVIQGFPSTPSRDRLLATLVQAVSAAGLGVVLRVGRGAGDWEGTRFNSLAAMFDQLQSQDEQPVELTADGQPPKKKLGWSNLFGLLGE